MFLRDCLRLVLPQVYYMAYLKYIRLIFIQNFNSDQFLLPMIVHSSALLNLWLTSLLNQYAYNGNSVKNSVAFVSDLNKVNINAHELYMTSFDVESLYTNVSLVETIDIIIVNKIFINSDTIFIGLTKILFRKLLEIVTTNCFFLFDNKLYKQCDGLGMGLPQSPAFADIFMSHNEEQWLYNHPSNFKPVFYRRYVDDTFILFTDKSHAAQFLNYINRQHDNINFTLETESNNSLSFLFLLKNRTMAF